MPDAAAGLKKPWYCSIRWITAGAVLLVLCAVLWGLFRPEPPITIGPRTTVILAPLASDGLPDYGQYVLDQIGRGTPPEENAAVLLMQAMWPMGVEAADLLDVCRELGIPATAPKEPPLVDPSENADERAVIAAWLAAKLPAGALPVTLGAWIEAVRSCDGWGTLGPTNPSPGRPRNVSPWYGLSPVKWPP